jgi:hypothetical protein
MKTISNDNKLDCVESIVRVLERTSAWRKAITINFPDDPRNMRAVNILDQLAIDAANLTDDQWADLRTHFGWASMPWRDSLSQTARQVGFHHRAKDLNSFVSALVQQLSLSSVAA